MPEVTFHASAFKEMRMGSGLSQSEIARRTGIDQSRLSKCENGLAVPTVPEAVLVATVLGVDVQEIVDRCFTVVTDRAKSEVA